MKYTKEFLLEKLNELWLKYGKIQTKLIDSEPNFPTRKCFINAFGSLENACNLIGYYDYKKREFDIADAQKTLDKRNGHFVLLTFNGMKNKALVQCKECLNVFETIPDSLLRDKTNEHYGCRNCNLKSFFNKLKFNNLEFIEYIGSGRCKVRCLNCDSIIEGAESNLTSPTYLCQNCDSDTISLKIDANKELFAEKTIKKNDFFLHLTKIISEESLQWYYCLGFFMADGNFHKDTKRFSMFIKKEDRDIIEKIALFLGCDVKTYKNVVGIDFCNDKILELIDKYHISNQKTYNPCDISSIENDRIIAFIIGFIDGDGSILKRIDNGHYKIVIKNHISWSNNLQYMTEKLYGYFNIKNVPHTYIVEQKQGTYIGVTWGNYNVLNGLVNFIKNNNLFVLQRKWNKIF